METLGWARRLLKQDRSVREMGDRPNDLYCRHNYLTPTTHYYISGISILAEEDWIRYCRSNYRVYF